MPCADASKDPEQNKIGEITQIENVGRQPTDANQFKK
jgi:hypothetical protein